MEHFLDAFRNYANFNGRATRQQYWMFILFYIIFYIVLSVIDGIIGTFLLSSIFSLVMLVPSIAYATRRLHDTDRSGWWQLIALIPIIGTIVLIVFLAQKSSDGQKFGAPVNA
ncbi:DUF805 domain-containing protein [Marinobacter sp.]|uniref:DUF805 domain-containing protein n=1 Tax=Marinobacter sp. TaxID=50741 RepID=UPI003564FA55